MPEPRPFTMPIHVRWRDLDALGHVNNAVYLTYFEMARFEYVRALAGSGGEVDPETLLPRDFQFILAETHIFYRSPALLTDKLELSLYVSSVGRKSFVVEYRLVVTLSGRLRAEACSTQVWYDYAVGESRPVPEEIIRRIENFQGATLERT